MIFIEAIDNRIRILAAERNVNQVELSRLSGISRPILSKMWKGETPLDTTTLGRLIDIAAGLNKKDNKKYKKLRWFDLLEGIKGENNEQG